MNMVDNAVDNYDRPLSAAEIPHRADIDKDYKQNLASLECVEIDRTTVVNPEWCFINNISLKINHLDQSNVPNLTVVVRECKDQVMGLNLNGLVCEDIYSEQLLTTVLEKGYLLYLLDLDLSFQELTNLTFDTLCNTLSTKISGYCPIKRLALSNCRYCYGGLLYVSLCCFTRYLLDRLGTKRSSKLFESLIGNVYVEELLFNGNLCTDHSLTILVQCFATGNNAFRELYMGNNMVSSAGIRFADIFVERM